MGFLSLPISVTDDDSWSIVLRRILRQRLRFVGKSNTINEGCRPWVKKGVVLALTLRVQKWTRFFPGPQSVSLGRSHAGCQPGAILSPRGHVKMLGDILMGIWTH